MRKLTHCDCSRHDDVRFASCTSNESADQLKCLYVQHCIHASRTTAIDERITLSVSLGQLCERLPLAATVPLLQPVAGPPSQVSWALNIKRPVFVTNILYGDDSDNCGQNACAIDLTSLPSCFQTMVLHSRRWACMVSQPA